MIYLITYQLNNKNRDYTDLYTAIKNYGSWWHYLDSTWLVSTAPRDVNVMAEDLRGHIDHDTDSLLVAEVNMRTRDGWLPQDAWDWIRRNST